MVRQHGTRSHRSPITTHRLGRATNFYLPTSASRIAKLSYLTFWQSILIIMGFVLTSADMAFSLVVAYEIQTQLPCFACSEFCRSLGRNVPFGPRHLHRHSRPNRPRRGRNRERFDRP